MSNVHFENVIKSFFLGLILGLILLVFDDPDATLTYKVLAVLASGSIGFIIGFVTEWLTAILPIRLANPRMYFFINNLIALVVATLLMVSLYWITGGDHESNAPFVPVLLTVLSIICIANLFDYMMYRRAQSKLKTYQATIKDK
ncbi:hypothetical protein ACX1C1_07860 [Paenibacillus sp. strain BS8-2]